MGFFKKSEKRPRWEPVTCQAKDILFLIQECLNINVPSIDILFRFGGEVYKAGISSDYSDRLGYFDTFLFLDTQEFQSLEALCAGAQLGGQPFSGVIEPLEVLEVDEGDPRNMTYLDNLEKSRQ